MIKPTKGAYFNGYVIEDIRACIALLCEHGEFCTPTDVLRLLGLDESPTTRTLVLELAQKDHFTVISSGKGYRIWAIPF